MSDEWQAEQDREAALERRRAQDAARGERRGVDLAWVMGSAQGRRVVWWLIDELAGVSNGTFAGEASHQTAYNEGVRAVGRAVTAEAQRVAETEYVRMLAEALAERRELAKR